MASTFPNNSTFIPNTLTSINLHSFITIKLNWDNYILWHAQVVPYLNDAQLFGYVDDTIPTPSSYIVVQLNGQNEVQVNPAFHHWHLHDQLILNALTSSLSEKTLSHMIKCKTSHEIWLSLEHMLASTSHAWITNIHFQHATLNKGALSIADYFQEFSTLANTLAAVD